MLYCIAQIRVILHRPNTCYTASPKYMFKMKLAILCAFFISVRASSEEQRVVVLFDKVDVDHNDSLTQQELDNVFLIFDTDNDSIVSPAEFERDWTNVFHIGGPQEAQALFARADINDDNQITSADLPEIFKYFDVDGDGTVNLSEFLTQWGELSNLPVRPVDVSVSVG